MNSMNNESAAPISELEGRTSGGFTMDCLPALIELKKLIRELVELGNEMDEWSSEGSSVICQDPVEVPAPDDAIYHAANVPGFKPEVIKICVKDDLTVTSGVTEHWEGTHADSSIYSHWMAPSSIAIYPSR